MKLGKTQGVEDLLLESLRIRDSLKTLPGIVASKIKRGEYYLYKKDTSKALIYLKEIDSKPKEEMGELFHFKNSKYN